MASILEQARATLVSMAEKLKNSIGVFGESGSGIGKKAKDSAANAAGAEEKCKELKGQAAAVLANSQAQDRFHVASLITLAENDAKAVVHTANLLEIKAKAARGSLARAEEALRKTASSL